LSFRNLRESTTHELSALDLGLWLALGVGSARMALGSGKIWRTLLRNHIGMLHEISIKMWPSSGASLNHVVAVEHLLHGEVVDILAILQLQSGLNRLDEAKCVAGAASFLVSMSIGEIVPTDASKVVGGWNLVIRDSVRRLVFLLESLGSIKRSLEAFTFTELELLRSFLIRLLIELEQRGLSETFTAILTLSESWMVLLELTGIHLKTKVMIIHRCYQKVHGV
jgi:hypothetical protein